MKKRLAAILVLISILIPVVFSTGCYFEDDFYGVYFNSDSSVFLTLRENNFASIGKGDSAETYYAEYLLLSNTINLRDAKDGYWGKIWGTIKINPDNIEELTLVRSATKQDENGNDYLDVEGVPDIVFVLNRNYK